MDWSFKMFMSVFWCYFLLKFLSLLWTRREGVYNGRTFTFNPGPIPQSLLPTSSLAIWLIITYRLLIHSIAKFWNNRNKMFSQFNPIFIFPISEQKVSHLDSNCIQRSKNIIILDKNDVTHPVVMSELNHSFMEALTERLPEQTVPTQASPTVPPSLFW